MTYKIQHSHYEAAFKLKGAELCSFKDTQNDIEYIWQYEGKPFWQRHAPVLFPIVGKLKDDEYLFEGKTYKMTQHGLVRDMEWEFVAQTQDSIHFKVCSNEATLKQYPFHFELHAFYQLSENQLISKYKIINTGDSLMYFSFGLHPAFHCPILPTDDLNEYHILFEKQEYARRELLEKSLYNGEHKLVMNMNQKLFMADFTFADDAIVFKSLNSRKIRLETPENAHFVEISFPEFHQLGIWKEVGAPFLCLEPWCGYADSVAGNLDFTHKEGILTLEAGKEWEIGCDISVG
jgi:galactose mutarotase-like enzyme